MAPQAGRDHSTSPRLAEPGNEPIREVVQEQCTGAVAGTQPAQSTVAYVVASRTLEVPGTNLSRVETNQSQQRAQQGAKSPASKVKAPSYRATLVGCWTEQVGDGCSVALQADGTRSQELHMAVAADRSWVQAIAPDGV